MGEPENMLCVGFTIDMSVDLGNSSHYDVGNVSQGFSVWTEEVPGLTSNLYLWCQIYMALEMMEIPIIAWLQDYSMAQPSAGTAVPSATALCWLLLLDDLKPSLSRKVRTTYTEHSRLQRSASYIRDNALQLPQRASGQIFVKGRMISSSNKSIERKSY